MIMTSSMNMSSMSSDEIAQYDRQIRLWGLEAQKRLRLANVLVVGLGGLGSEVVKNIVLAGVSSITLLDDRLASEDDLCSQLLITPTDLGRNLAEASKSRTEELNPNVEVHVDTDDVRLKEAAYFDKFHVVCLTSCDESLRVKIDNICREKQIKFFCGGVFGYFGYCFSDLGEHEYVVDVPLKSNSDSRITDAQSETMTIKKKLKFCKYEETMKEDWSKRSRKQLKHSSQVFFILRILDRFENEQERQPEPSDEQILGEIRTKLLSESCVSSAFVQEDFQKFCFSVLSPVAAIVGGVLSQEIIKAISKKDQPHNNYFFFDGLNHVGVVDCICPE